MAMSSSVLKTAVKARMISEGFMLADPFCKAEKFIDILCEEIVTHITTLAQVNSVLTVASATALTPTAPGTGTGIGMIS